MEHDCQCNLDSRDHEANQCDKMAIRLYSRQGRLLWLCHDCRLTGDVPATSELTDDYGME